MRDRAQGVGGVADQGMTMALPSGTLTAMDFARLAVPNRSSRALIVSTGQTIFAI
jgi:hypothetical protein